MPTSLDTGVRIHRDGSVWTIAIDRPHVKNAVDRPTAHALAEAFREFEADPWARVAVLAGGGGTFCAGADLQRVVDGEGNRTEPDGDGPMGPTRMLLSKPTIAAIDGHAVGGGMELALWCDLRVMEDDAVLGFFNRRWGVPLVDGGSVRLPRLVGLSRAMDLILTGREVRADEAHAIGLIHRIVAPGYARKVALEMAHALAHMPQHALRGDRASAYESTSLPLDAALANEFHRGVPALQKEAREGAKRFLASRSRSEP
ncbi:MAG TPA: crotonase/enoyl-CoA hydratase family protein [Candidatus Thermoplasmatota archaeon]|nr:crotonase/enoyl-CoA hydratase family protein [Candidatus Thermoplasmatota archaeon]